MLYRIFQGFALPTLLVIKFDGFALPTPLVIKLSNSNLNCFCSFQFQRRAKLGTVSKDALIPHEEEPSEEVSKP